MDTSKVYNNMDLVNTWLEYDKKLKFYKQEEGKARKAMWKTCFPSEKKGTVNVEFGGGLKLKATFKENVNLTKEAKTNNGALVQQFVANNPEFAPAISYEPKLSKTEFEKLSTEVRKKFNQFLEIKEGTPSFEMKHEDK